MHFLSGSFGATALRSALWAPAVDIGVGIALILLAGTDGGGV